MGLASRLTDMKKKGKMKPKKVNLGSKGGFTIKHPGAFRAFASKKGLSTKEAADEYKGASGVIGRRARSALGLMAMSKK